MKNLKLLFIVFIMMSFVASEAQDSYFSKFKPSKRWSVGVQISPTHLNGDADDAKIGLSGGAHIKYSISQSFGLKLNGDIGVLKGGRLEPDFSGNKNNGRFGNTTIVDSKADNFLGNGGNQAPSVDPYQFRNNFKDLNLTAVYTLGNLSFIRPLRKVQLFTFFGFGAIWSDVIGHYENTEDAAGASAHAREMYTAWGKEYFTGFDASGQETSVVADITDVESYYKGRNMTVPFGFGVKRNFGRVLDLGLEWRSHWTRSDALDAFSFPIWRNRYSDFYTLVGLQASFKIGANGNKDHYDWLNPMETVYADLDSIKEITSKLKNLIDDKDGDGVSDLFDVEADTDCDKVYGNGKAMDSDNDGINDCKDVQPFSICDDVDKNGKAKDDDNDGVPNCIDVELNSAAGELVDVKGKTVEYAKPNSLGASGSIAGNSGCCNCDNVVLPSIVFDNSSSRISPSSYGVLYTVAEKMKQCPGLSISATGYTSSKSGEQLAWKRSNAIIDHLEANYGIERSRINTTYGTGSGIEYSTRRVDLNQAGY